MIFNFSLFNLSLIGKLTQMCRPQAQLNTGLVRNKNLFRDDAPRYDDGLTGDSMSFR